MKRKKGCIMIQTIYHYKNRAFLQWHCLWKTCMVLSWCIHTGFDTLG